MAGGGNVAFGEGLRMLANLATAHDAEQVLAQTEVIGLYLLGAPPGRVELDIDVDRGLLTRLPDFCGGALVAKLGDTLIAWTGRAFTDEEFEVLAPVIPVAQDTLDRIEKAPKRLLNTRSRGSEAMISALVETLDAPVWVVDQDCRLIAFNSAFVRFIHAAVGVTPAVGASVFSMPEPYRSQHQKLYRSVMHHGPRRLDWPMPDGSIVYDVMMQPIGEPLIGVAVTCRDITDVRKHEAALREAQAQAEKANRAKTEFLAHMSHEIRTPLNAIIGLTDLVLAEPLPEDIRHPMRGVKTNSRALLHLVSGILDFTRIESGVLEVRPAPADISITVRDAIDMLRDKADARGLTLTLDVADNVPGRVQIDADRVRQIVVNLVDNGIKYTPEGGVSVRLDCEDDLVIEVEDTGVGMQEEQLESVFTRFTRLDATAQIDGVGLGLAISRSLAEAMGGSLNVRSTPSVGSRFRLQLPLEVVRHRRRASQPGELGKLRRNLRILLVDDAPSNLAVTSALLRKIGHQVECEASGEAALTRIEEPFDLILMDVHMPGIGGLEATRRLRQLGCVVPVVALTAHAIKEMVDRCTDAGMQAMLIKPIPAATLDESVLAHARPPSVLIVHPDPALRQIAKTWLEEAGALVQTAAEPVNEPFDVVLQGGSFERADLLRRTEAALRDAPR